MKIIGYLLVLLLAAMLLAHIFFPFLIGAVVITSTLWGFIIASIFIFSMTLILLFLFSGVGLFLLALFTSIWVVIAVALFPLLFPVLLPLLMVVLFISWVRKKANSQKG